MHFIKEFEKIPNNIFFYIILVLLLQFYNFQYIALGKLIIITIIVIITINNKKIGLLLAIISLFLNQKITETMENNENNENKKLDLNQTIKKNHKNIINQLNEQSNENQNKLNNNIELNDAIATFKKIHCKNGKIIDKNGKELQINDLSKYYPSIKFELENKNCNPCKDSCNFKLTSSNERISIEEKMRPIPAPAPAPATEPSPNT